MPQSLSRMHVHLVFSTKQRQRLITPHIQQALHAYMAAVLQNYGCPPVLINSVADHVHILFDLGRTVALSKAVEEVKTTSSKWIKTQGREFAAFAWQGGYAGFSVSDTDVASVRDYIARQAEHHRVRSFQEEVRELLEGQGVSFDERYVWD